MMRILAPLSALQPPRSLSCFANDQLWYLHISPASSIKRVGTSYIRGLYKSSKTGQLNTMPAQATPSKTAYTKWLSRCVVNHIPHINIHSIKMIFNSINQGNIWTERKIFSVSLMASSCVNLQPELPQKLHPI